MKKPTTLIALTLICLLLGPALPAADSPIVIPLWPKGLPEGKSVQLEEVWTDRPITDGTDTKMDRSVKDISLPTITVYLPPKPNAFRTSIVILPGGVRSQFHSTHVWTGFHA